MKRSACFLLTLGVTIAILRADTIELMNGAKVEGTVIENNADAKTVTVEFLLGGQKATRTVPHATVHAITVAGARTVLTPKAGQQGGTAKVAPTPAEIQQTIDRVGSTEPDWLDRTRLNYPDTLDLSWPADPPKPWNPQKNMGQYIWDVINPNTGRWEEGVKLMYLLLEKNKGDNDVRERIVLSLASMYFRFFQDYPRAAYWWKQAGIVADDNSAVSLAECYWRMGSKQMAIDLLEESRYVRLGAIKLYGDMGETQRAIKQADSYAKADGDGDPHEAWLLAGDACRLAGRAEEATAYYEKAISTPGSGQGAQRLQKVKNRAQANLAALKLFDLADVSKVKDGTYQDSSLGYEAQVEISVKVRGGKIEDLKVTQHREKQYYSSLTDVPAQIIAKQSVKGVDATSRATITGEAIINATAKALAKGAP
jgi:uncharacterized protein with FMN-binding domain